MLLAGGNFEREHGVDLAEKIGSLFVYMIKEGVADSEITRLDIKHRTEQILMDFLEEYAGISEGVSVRVEESFYKNGELAVKPENLFTLILLHGFYVPYHIIKNYDEYNASNGTKYLILEGEPLIILAPSTESVEINLIVERFGFWKILMEKFREKILFPLKRLLK